MLEIFVESVESEQILEDTVQVSVNQFQNIYTKYGNSSVNQVLNKISARITFLQKELKNQRELNKSLHSEFKKVNFLHNSQIKKIKKLEHQLKVLIDSK